MERGVVKLGVTIEELLSVTEVNTQLDSLSVNTTHTLFKFALLLHLSLDTQRKANTSHAQ